MDNRVLSQKIIDELNYADTHSKFDIDEYMRTARAYFDAELPGTIDEDLDEVFQTVVSQDIANAVEHTLADIMPALQSNRLVVFKPLGMEDAVKADQETIIVNDVIINESDGVRVFTEAIKNGLMYKRAVVEVRVEETIIPQYIEFVDAIVEDVLAQGLDIVSVNGESEDVQRYLGQPAAILARQYSTQKQLVVEAVPIDEFRINADHQSIDLDRARFVARDYRVMASDIVQMGVDADIVKDLPDYSDTDTSVDKSFDDYITADESTRAIRLIRAFYRIDADDDGIAELRYILAAGNDSNLTIIENIPVSEQPFVLGVPLVDQHKSFGVSLTDKLIQVQTLKTKLLRQILSANERAIRGRVGLVEGLVNEDDYSDTVFGGFIRMAAPGGIVPLPSDPFPQQAYSALEYQDKIRSESGGSAIDKATQENLPVSQESSAHGVERILSAMEQLNTYIASNIFNTLVKKVYCKVHATLRQTWDQEVSAEVNGQWISGTPTTWPVRNKAQVTVGMTLGERNAYVALLTQLINEASLMKEKGSLLVTDETIFRLLEQRAMYTSIPGMQSLYINPQSPEYAQMSKQRAQMAQQQQQQQMMQMQQQNQLLLALEEVRAQGRIQAQQIKAQSDLIKSDSESKLKLEEKLRQLALEYDKLSVELIKLNAEYDKQDVPDTISEATGGPETVQ